ncbi:PaaI family thioesterase [Metapseudomonas resinovorans]|uniref:PaaI family thioesterase n=1 Tax=Metapseudomonas resinovorans TaxID=53412 RepID=UPI0004279F20|nr:PaaI family thioesterase [Pseudomonas resinovorans]MDE3739666.1 PaaI family thioesterase [Pseudomonas resinovorans]
MRDLTREETLQAWLAAEAEIRARLKPGTMSIADVATLSPLEFFDGIGQGDLPAPPIGELMGFVPIEWSKDCFIFQGVPQMQHYNPIGSVHGGYAATLLDSAMGCAIHANLERGQGYTTTDLRISYIRALTTKTGPVRAEGRIIHVGRSTALAEGRIYDVDGKLYATGSTTCLILGGK